MSGTALQLNIADDIATITLDQHGSRANILSTNTWNELAGAITAACAQPAIKGLILVSGKDGMFIAGADLKELDALPTDDSQPTRALLQLGHRVLEMLESAPFPTVAAIDGACLGGGLEVAMACDYRLAGSHPKFKIGLPEVKLGLIPGWGGTQRLPRIVGGFVGIEFLVTGRTLTADDAWRYGLVDVVYPSEELIEAAKRCLRDSQLEERTARRRTKQAPARREAPSHMRELISKMPDDEQPAARAALQVVESGCQLPLPLALQRETEAFIPLLASPAARKKLTAFLKK